MLAFPPTGCRSKASRVRRSSERSAVAIRATRSTCCRRTRRCWKSATSSSEPVTSSTSTRTEPVRLVLVHLYPDLMNVYGDRGNILALERRAAWRDVELEVRGCTLGEDFDPDETDLIFFGGGQDRE